MTKIRSLYLILLLYFGQFLQGQLDPRIASVLGNLSAQQKQMLAASVGMMNQRTNQKPDAGIKEDEDALVTDEDSDKSKNELQEEESLSLEQIDELLTILTPYTFQYKDQTYGAGKRFGIMAQDLEKSDVGKQFVIDTPVGKMVDFGNMMGLIVASQAYLHECSVR